MYVLCVCVVCVYVLCVCMCPSTIMPPNAKGLIF